MTTSQRIQDYTGRKTGYLGSHTADTVDHLEHVFDTARQYHLDTTEVEQALRIVRSARTCVQAAA